MFSGSAIYMLRFQNKKKKKKNGGFKSVTNKVLNVDVDR